jgi:hypothetical protein
MMPRPNLLDDFDFDDTPMFEGGDEGEVVAKYYDALKAQLAAARLRAAGIPCFLASSTAQSVLPHLQLLVRLQVRPQDLHRAREVLGEAEIDDPEAAGSQEAPFWPVVVILAVVIAIILVALLVQALGL